MTNKEELEEVPESFEVNAEEDEDEVEEESEEEAGFEQEIGRSTSEKIMRKYFLNR